MEFLTFQIRRIFGLFASIFSAPRDVIGMVWDGSGRSNSLVLGLPAVILGLAGFLSVFLMEWAGKEAMVESYSNRVESIANRQKLLDTQLRQSIISKVSLDGGAVDSQKLQQLRAEDPRSDEITALGEESIVYLNKLRNLEPDVRDHQYELALRYFGLGDAFSKKRCFEILEQIAPEDRPGHPAAHLLLARRNERLPAKSALDKLYNIDVALNHVGQCLTLDPNNIEALKIKARLLRAKGSNKESKDTFQRLFKEDPIYAQALLELKPSEADRAVILSSAATRYISQLKKKEVRENTIQWVRTWEGVANILTQKKDFERYKDLLEKDLKEYSQNEKTAARVPFLKQYIARMYVSWANYEIGDPLKSTSLDFTESEQKRLLDYFGKAFSYNEKDRFVLQNLAKLGTSSFPSIAEAAKQIYDPALSNNLPPGVLNQIALEALTTKDYSAAQEYYERAKTLSPNNPGILNNLAYAYLKEQEAKPDMPENERISNAARAHRLVEQAIRQLPERMKKSPEISMYRHTLGTALMQLGNYPGAAAQFELALTTRPTAPELLKSLIECYDTFGLDSTIYQRKLEQALRNQ